MSHTHKLIKHMHATLFDDGVGCVQGVDCACADRHQVGSDSSSSTTGNNIQCFCASNKRGAGAASALSPPPTHSTPHRFVDIEKKCYLWRACVHTRSCFGACRPGKTKKFAMCACAWCLCLCERAFNLMCKLRVLFIGMPAQMSGWRVYVEDDGRTDSRERVGED